MKLYAPKYYRNFKCIADKCEHSCCIGWEIDVDQCTIEKYKSLKKGYGLTVLDTISKDSEPHFVLGEGDRCPHLDKNGLCKIITNLGSNYLCDICREHPRFYNYTSVSEVGIGLSCPEAARVVLSSPDYNILEEIGEVCSVYEEIEFDGRKNRARIYEILGDTTLDYKSRLDKIYRTYQIDVGSDEKWLEIIDSLEYLDKEHKTLFKGYCASYRPDKVDEYLERFLAYLLYRHATEAIDIDDFSSRLSFCLFCERLFASLIYIDDAKSLNEIAKLATIISEEIEYSSDNTLALRESNPFGLK